jgi:DNA-binding MarR family transcriptional regulator
MAGESSTLELQRAITEALLRVLNKVAQSRGATRDYGGEQLTMVEAQTCFLISLANGLTPSDVAGATGVSRPAVSRVLSRLRARGFVRSVPSRSDARSHSLRLTPAGKRVARSIGRMFDDMRSQVFDADPKDLCAMLDLFERIETFLDAVLKA